MYVVIPAYQPTSGLVTLVAELLQARPSLDVLVVDDGSDEGCRPVFVGCAELGAGVLRLPVNGGKGQALRAAFLHLLEVRAHGVVVTADADGQHAVADVLAVGDAVDDTTEADETPPHLVIGERAFSSSVPLRSRVGNAATRVLFRAATGRRIHDTQTGLRAFPSALLPWLTTVKGDRYEYELTMLLQAARQQVPIRTVPIQTIYLDDNASSHFRPVADSVRIYAPLLGFLASSLTGFVVDLGAFLALYGLTGAVLPAVVGARVVSASVNFGLNRRLVFPGAGRGRAAGRYAALAGVLLAANYLVLSMLHGVGLPLVAAKVLTEVVLVVASYVVQARCVFRDVRRPPARPGVARRPA